jgi:hypothetical protein
MDRFQNIFEEKRRHETERFTKNLEYNRARMRKNGPIEEYLIPEALPLLETDRGTPSTKSNRKKYTITKYRSQVRDTHMHYEFRR